MKKVKVPRYIDNPMQVLLWELDDVLPFIGFFGVGLLLDKLIWFLPVGIILSRQMIKMKQSNLRGLLKHTGYWAGLITLNKRDNNGLRREYIQ